MKKVLALLTAALAAAILLPACGGGGGGGGGATAPPPRPPVYSPEAEANFGVGSKVVPVDTSDDPGNNDFGITKTPDGLILSDNGIGRQVTIPAGDFSDDPTNPNLITATDSSNGVFAPDISYAVTDTVSLGGKKIGLSHSDFGMWDSQQQLSGPGIVGGVVVNQGIFTPLTMGDPNKTAAFTGGGSGSQTFSGPTIAAAQGGEPDTNLNGVYTESSERLTGTVDLTVDLNNPNNSDLNIYLNNFADFYIPVGIDGSGAISSRGNANASNVSTGRDLSGTLTNTVKGQFYGDSPNAPSEGVGSYFIKGSSWGPNGDAYYPIRVNGSFGVKKP